MKKFILLLVVGLLFTTSVSAAEFNADLRYGVAKNAEVTKLQKFLTAEKLYSGPITGNFYSLTLKAVKAFQAREKIPTSGLVDALTRAQLNDLIAKRPLDNSVSAPSSAAEFNADLRYGVAKNAEVTKLQKFLTAEKLYSGPITGNFYSLTLKAVKAFQAREKIPTSGLVDALTRAQLNDLIAKRPLDNSVSAPSSAAEFNADLRYGVAKNAEVTKLQKFLTAEKLYSGPITGNFYSLTLKAVKAFQAREKIPTSGLVDALTRAQLNDLIAKRPLDNSVSAPSSAAEFNADLRYGVAKNAEVTKLQKFLTAEKLYSGPITGNFYSLTLKAVKAFQAREKIPTSGLVDALTRAQLNDLIAKRPLDNSVSAPSSAAEFNADLRYGVAKNAEVTKLQKFLTAEKLYSGPITGNFYSLTLKAVKAFQAREKIPTSGLVDALTRAQLNDLIAKRPLDNSVSAPSSAAEFNADLRYGVAKNAEVTKLQKFLTAEKLYSGPITGNFYSLTLKAVKAFQAREKIPTSGLVDALTRAQLNDLIAKRPLDNSVSAPSSAAEFNADLRYGVAKNAEVTKLQKFLTAEKLYSGPITGNFYSLTLKAVKAFQAREKIPTSGLVDALTRAQLNDLIAKRPLDNSVSAPSSAAEFNADLRYGVAKNAEVTKLQKFLTAEKLYSGPITGNFYSLTLKAVKAFQAREKI